MARGDEGDRRLSVRRYRLVLWAVAVLGLLGGGLALVGRSMSHASIHGGDWQENASFIAITAVAFVALLLLLLLPPALRFYRIRQERHVAQVRQARPDAVVIPAYSSRDLWSDAVDAGADPRGITRTLTTTLALALVGDTAEVWIRGDQEPRWSVRITGARIEPQEIAMGETSQLGLRISDGSTSVSFIPYYRRSTRVRAVERALQDLGEDPADYLKR